MSYHVSVAYIMYALPFLASSQVIVGLRWPHPRWFIGTGSTPVASDVVSNGVQVVSNGVNVVSS